MRLLSKNYSVEDLHANSIEERRKDLEGMLHGDKTVYEKMKPYAGV